MTEGPAGPRVGVGGVVVHDGRVLLIRRGKPPLLGRWIIPGGTVELGETLEQALVREMEEETGLRVRPGELLCLFDHIERDAGRVRYHYVIADYLCELESGTLRAGSDALEAAFVAPRELPAYDLPPKALEVIRAALARASARLRDPGSGEVTPAPC